MDRYFKPFYNALAIGREAAKVGYEVRRQDRLDEERQSQNALANQVRQMQMMKLAQEMGAAERQQDQQLAFANALQQRMEPQQVGGPLRDVPFQPVQDVPASPITNREMGLLYAQHGMADKAAQYLAKGGEKSGLKLTETPLGYAYLPEEIEAGQEPPKPVMVKDLPSAKALENQRAELKRVRELQQKTFENADKLRDEYTAGSKEFIKVRDAYGRIQAAAQEPSAAGDLALIFNYMKMLDPGSTVREGEFANAQNSAGVPQRVTSLYNRLLNGQRLAAEQRQDFIGRSQKLFSSMERSQERLKLEYTRLANRNDIDPADVIIDYSLDNDPMGLR